MALIFLISTSLFGFFDDDEESAAQILQIPKEARHVKVSVITPRPADMPIDITVGAVVESVLEHSIDVQAEGVLHTRVVNEQRVKKSEIIATIEDRRRKNDLRIVKNRITLLQSEVEIEQKKLISAKEVLKLGIISTNDYLTQKSILKEKQILLQSARNREQNLQLQNQKSIIRSPVSGFVSQLAADGSYVAYGSTICRIYDENVQIRLFVPIHYARALHQGEKVELANDGKTIDAVITEILPKTTGNLVDVIAHSASSLPLGLNLQVRIVTHKRSGWIIPKDSIVLVQNRPAVFLIKKNKAALHFITVEKDMIDKVLATDHLQEEDKIALKNAYMLHDGTIVEVVK